jgi:LysR family transcriptional regulator, hydrogen peroxide-inducible genes activator
VALPHDHRLAAERRITPSALISEAIVLLEEGHCLRDQSLSICGAAGLNNCRDDVQAAGLETLCQMVMAGIGIALVPELATQGPFGAGELAIYRRFEPPEPKRELVLAWRRGLPRGDALQELARGLRGAPA